MDVSGRGKGENPELGLVSGSSSSSSSGGSLKVTSSSFSSPPLDVKLRSRLFSVDHKVEQNQSINQSFQGPRFSKALETFWVGKATFR